MRKYIVKKASQKPDLSAEWNGAQWSAANIAEIDNFRVESSDHRPRAQAKMLYDEDGVYGMFLVHDKYVRSVATEFQGSVCKDSCVEFFFKPLKDKGYLNLECNCGGTFLCFYVIDHTRTETGFKDYVRLTEEDSRQFKIFHTMPAVVEPEIKEDTVWRLAFHIPFALMEKYTGPLGKKQGMEWTVNFFKCGDDTSHPHWASWSPVDKLNFHLPECFAPIVFE